jgi:hypothetical protein
MPQLGDAGGIVDLVAHRRSAAELMNAVALGLLDRPVASFSFMGGTLPSGATLTRATTGKRVNSSRLLEADSANMARFTYDPSSGALQGLLVEPSRTNLCVQSNAFSTTWTSNGPTLSTGSDTSPDGTTNAWRMVQKAANVGQNIYIPLVNVPGGNDQAVAFSVYLKQASARYAQLGFDNSGTNGCGLVVDLQTGAIGTGTYGTGFLTAAQAIAAGYGWWRVTLLGGMTNESQYSIDIGMAPNGTWSQNAPLFTGDGSSYIGIYGASMESTTNSSAAASMLIDTSGSSATRAADVLTLAMKNGTYNVQVVRVGGIATLPQQQVTGGQYTVPTDPSPLQSVIFR